jgi:hypothetical protein
MNRKIDDEKLLEDEPVVEFEFTTRMDYIQASYFSLASIEGIDTMIMTKNDERRVKRIKRKSLKIIDCCLSEMYDELFDDREDLEDN